MSARKRGKVLARPATVEQTAEPENCEEVQVRESIQCQWIEWRGGEGGATV